MDRRGWPWKKKSSEKTSNSDASNGSGGCQGEDDTRAANLVQITPEQYAHFVDLEEQVKTLSEQVTSLNEKVSALQSELLTKDGLVKQHEKVADEAISGWEKAEAESSTLKLQLETVTLSKLVAEERAVHLDGALKECVKEVRAAKEEGEQKLHDVVFARTKQWEKVKAELEGKILDFDRDLQRADAENAALTRSLQERSDFVMKIAEEKEQADAEIELLRKKIQAEEKEVNSLKYELHVIAKELEIRNEEKNMSVRSAEAANKLHSEDVKKISKLEAECQRLRSLVRKKLPGPAALAQMKSEVESFARPRTAKGSIMRNYPASTPDLAIKNLDQFQKENEFLTARVLAMEEETNFLKEALSKANAELHASRNLNNRQKTTPSIGNGDVGYDSMLSRKGSHPSSFYSMSENGADDNGSCSESSPSAFPSELLAFSKGKELAKLNNIQNAKHMELMDDFLEMERLANGSSGSVADEVKVEMVEAEPSDKLKRDGNDSNSSRVPATSSTSDEELIIALSRIQEFIKSFKRDAVVGHTAKSGDHELCDRIEKLNSSVDRISSRETNLHDLIVSLAQILSDTSEIKLMASQNNTGSDTTGLEYIDKVALLENRVSGHNEPIKEDICAPVPLSSSEPELGGYVCAGFEVKTEVRVCFPDDYELLKSEKANLEAELASAKLSLVETDKSIEELRLELVDCQRSNSLSETQLKCMAESYKLLESRKQELDDEITSLRSMIDGLAVELSEERQSHQVHLDELKELQEKIQRYEESGEFTKGSAATPTPQEKKITAATEKLAECQNTITLLSRQLQDLQPQANLSPSRQNPQHASDISEDEGTARPTQTPPRSLLMFQEDQAAGSAWPRSSAGNDSPCSVVYHINNMSEPELSPLRQSPNHTVKLRRHRQWLLTPSSSSLPVASPEKHASGFSRFFSRGKSAN